MRVDHPDQVVLKADPPRCLSYRWHTFTLELGEAVGIDEETRAPATPAEPARP